jgi:GTPase SAR1 family protein
MNEIELYAAPYAEMVLIGNKVDLEGERQVEEEEGKKFANEWNMDFLEISSTEETSIT